ncbi:hypothetical protein NQ314_002537 [Rhamnusium bicolor]|uniref:DUF5641 domain-containing protein n=1 Tax=Rhamnusium bicolor TaxID=1586634 RepID=A0AAV8ZRQ1_9CUCU|nr:hypothetical protein NQ314_002537 [Rhamnusium bicolor]
MWELEDFTPPVPTSEDSICENYFVENVSRNSFGRYEVALPFKADPTHLGDSFALSQTRLPDIKNAVTIHTQLVKLFENGGFQMVKWMSNSNELLSQIPDFLQLNTPIAFDKESLKVLGLEWNPSSDNFSFKISVSVSPCTKRNMLSLVARIFDPLGFLAPISLFIKLLIKKLWKLKFDWDQEAPKEMFHLWMKFQEELTLLNSLRIPRHLLIFENSTVDIVGFADASSSAYAAWPIKSFSNNEFTIPEEENLIYLVVKPTISPLYILIEYFSSWTKLLHSTIYVLKFLKILPRNNTIRKFDLDQAEYTLIRAVQQRHFHSEYKLLSENKPLKSNFLRKLNPFIKDHVIRVGGRLSNANVAFDHKHPILLPKSDPFVNLLIDYTHKKYCHTGTHLLQSLLQQNYWILAARGIIRQRIWKCNHSEDLLTESPNRLNRYKLLDSVVQHYWKRWHIEYLSTLQARQKWNTPTNPAQIGMIVVIIQNNIPPLQWPLAIIEKLYPGKDGISRVALVRTKNSSYTRPVAKLCPLPNQS